MKSNEILKTMMSNKGVTQKELQARLGLKSTSSITQYLRNEIRCETFAKLAEVLGYEVVVKDLATGDEIRLGEEPKLTTEQRMSLLENSGEK